MEDFIMEEGRPWYDFEWKCDLNLKMIAIERRVKSIISLVGTFGKGAEAASEIHQLSTDNAKMRADLTYGVKDGDYQELYRAYLEKDLRAVVELEKKAACLEPVMALFCKVSHEKFREKACLKKLYALYGQSEDLLTRQGDHQQDWIPDVDKELEGAVDDLEQKLLLKSHYVYSVLDRGSHHCWNLYNLSVGNVEMLTYLLYGRETDEFIRQYEDHLETMMPLFEELMKQGAPLETLCDDVNAVCYIMFEERRWLKALSAKYDKPIPAKLPSEIEWDDYPLPR